MEITDKCLFVTADLRQYDGDGAGAGVGADGISGSSATGSDTNGGGKVAASRKSANPLANVQYGKPAPGSATGNDGATISADGKEQTQTKAPADKAKDFEALINGDYKDEFNRHLQSTIDKRFSDYKPVKAQLEATNKVLEKLSAKYGTSDLKNLEAAIDADNAYYEQEASKLGMPVEQYRQFQQTKAVNERLLQAQADAQKNQEADRVFKGWIDECEALKTSGKAQYANIDLVAEISNPQFADLIKRGVPVKAAFDVVHLDDMQSLIAKAVAAETQKKTVNSIRQQSARPAENGTGNTAGVDSRPDPSKWTKADRAEAIRRAARGEKIYL